MFLFLGICEIDGNILFVMDICITFIDRNNFCRSDISHIVSSYVNVPLRRIFYDFSKLHFVSRVIILGVKWITICFFLISCLMKKQMGKWGSEIRLRHMLLQSQTNHHRLVMESNHKIRNVCESNKFLITRKIPCNRLMYIKKSHHNLYLNLQHKKNNSNRSFLHTSTCQYLKIQNMKFNLHSNLT